VVVALAVALVVTVAVWVIVAVALAVAVCAGVCVAVAIAVPVAVTVAGRADGVGVAGQPFNALLIAAITSLIVTVLLASVSKAGQADTAARPLAMPMPVTISLMSTWPLPSQSPPHWPAAAPATNITAPAASISIDVRIRAGSLLPIGSRDGGVAGAA
jgi:hypothetical protein